MLSSEAGDKSICSMPAVTAYKLAALTAACLTRFLSLAWLAGQDITHTAQHHSEHLSLANKPLATQFIKTLTYLNLKTLKYSFASHKQRAS